jgi:hypothetical protein
MARDGLLDHVVSDRGCFASELPGSRADAPGPGAAHPFVAGTYDSISSRKFIGPNNYLGFNFLQLPIRLVQGLVVYTERALFLEPLPFKIGIGLHGLLKRQRLSILRGFRGKRPKSFEAQFVSGFPEFGQVNPEEFLPLVDFVYLPFDEPPMQCGLKRGSIIGSEHRVHIEGEGHAGVTEFSDPLVGIKPSGQPDFIDVLTERADVGDDINIAFLRLLGHGNRFLVLFLGFNEFDV